MSISKYLLLVLVSAFTAVIAPDASAQTPVNVSTLKILGRGVESRGTGESLALACTKTKTEETGAADTKVDNSESTDGCDTLNFVYFKNATEAYYIGTPIEMPKSSDPKLEKKALKLIIDSYFKKHKPLVTDAKLDKKAKRFFIIAVGGALLIGLLNPVTGALAGITFLKLIGFESLLLILSFNHGIENMLIGGNLHEVKMTDQNGWNWTVEPKKISRHRFGLALDRIMHGVLPEGVDRSLKKDIRQLESLQKEGVEIPAEDLKEYHNEWHEGQEFHFSFSN